MCRALQCWDGFDSHLFILIIIIYLIAVELFLKSVPLSTSRFVDIATPISHTFKTQIFRLIKILRNFK